MSYTVPAVGETWRAKELPDFIDVTVHIDKVTGGDAGEAVVEFTATTVVGKASNVRPRAVPLNRFIQRYQPVTEPFDPPPTDVWGVPT